MHSEYPEPQLSFAFEVCVDVDPPRRIGRGDGEEVFFTPITGGSVQGPRLNGVVLPGGGDWNTGRHDGREFELEARYLIEADDGAVIDIVNRGYWVASSEVESRLLAGEEVPESEYYYRTSPMFRTDAPAHRWLARTVFIGMARGTMERVSIRFFELG